MTARSRFVLCALLLLCPSWHQVAYGRGGSVVGNGAGLVENNFQYSYAMLPSLIATCLASTSCNVRGDQRTLLQKISEIAVNNSTNPDRILFKDEIANPGFFDTGISEKHRIAKTSLTPDEPIYVNTQMLYDTEGLPQLDYSTIISILIHEIGHQTGETSHSILDMLGSEIKKLSQKRIATDRMHFEGSRTAIEVSVANTEAPARSADLYFGWQGVGSVKATGALLEGLGCAEKTATLSGIEITNGAFFLTRPLLNESISEIGYGVWINLFCYSSAHASIRIESFAVRAKLKKDLSVEILDSTILK